MIKNYIIGKLSSKTRGNEYKKAVSQALSPESIANCCPTCDKKMPKKK